MDGWHWMGLDDDFPIRQVLPVGLARALGRCWVRFFMAKNSMLLNTFIFILHFFRGQGRREWVDGFWMM
jgi:hypothetical protein